jgi:CRP-like cAMP-binding protein
MTLEKAYLFQGMSEQARSEASRIAAEERHETGELLFDTGDPAEHLYILVEGRVRLSTGGAGHIAHIVSDPGDAIGWSSMAGNESYTASAECLGPVKVLKFQRDRLVKLLENDPVSGMSFYRRLAELIGRRLVASYGATLSVHGERHPKYWG